MMDEKETIADIVADIRAQNQGLPEDGYALSPLVCDLLRLAKRIEAAYKRLAIPTPEQWTEFARQGSELERLRNELQYIAEATSNSTTEGARHIHDVAVKALAKGE